MGTETDMILQLFQGGNEDVMAVLRHPENAGLIALIIGVPELYIPGDDSRNKQLVEIGDAYSGPIPTGAPPQGGPPSPQPGGPPHSGMPAPPQPPGMQSPQGPMPPMGPNSPEGASENPPPEGAPMPGLESSVRVEPTLDEHLVEMLTCQAWLRSEVGLQYKKENPGAYLNVLLHMQAHQMFVQQQQQMEQEQAAKEQGGLDNKKQFPPKK